MLFFLRDRVPLAAILAASEPARRDGAAGLADIYRSVFCHYASMRVWIGPSARP